MSATSTIPAQQLGRTPRESAGVIAQNAVPEVQQALELMQIPGAAYAAGVTQTAGKFEGLVHIALGSSEAYEFARWVRAHATEEEKQALAEARGESGDGPS
ncbi:hypothetical protein AB0J38_32960 [Streptomyces sp. NPDC050095]|uniref:hypothetical protein n=1 Tax=unclassified Streptomyces TaxID=2593676 RepID=UPI00343D4CC6